MSIGKAAAFTPFEKGHFACLGRRLAKQAVTFILALLIWVFDMGQETGKNIGGGRGT